LRAVLDTNVLVSAFAFPGGSPEAAYRLAVAGEIELVASRALLLEFARVLQGKFGWRPDAVEDVIAQVVRISRIAEPVATVCDLRDDPADNRVLEAADAGRAEAVCTGDRHLLALGRWRDIPILTPTQLVAQLSDRSTR
jgi:putative PIN family toxin of toxin-antitoxin system